MKNMSPQLSRMVSTLRQYYPQATVDAVIDDAEVKAIERGGRQITVADWDAVMDDQPIDGSGHRIVSSAWVSSLVMLMSPNANKG